VARILLVEDDAAMAAGLAYNLRRAGHEVLLAGDGPTGLRLAREGAPDLVVLDVMLPGLDGFAVLERLRAGGSRVPVVVLSALGEEEQKVRCLDGGAQDYVTKPFSVAELLARVRVRLGESAAAPEGDAFALGAGVVRLAGLEFVAGGHTVALTPTEVQLLRLLHARRGAAVAREEILREVWGVDDQSTRTLDTHVARLRRKLEPDPAHPRHLVTVHGVGYRLVASS